MAAVLFANERKEALVKTYITATDRFDRASQIAAEVKTGYFRAAVGGLVGVVAFSGLMRYVAPTMIGHPMDVPAMVAHIIGAPLMLGMLIHMFLGVLVFPFVYILVRRFLPGPAVIKGMIFAFGLFIVAESVVMPMAGNGFWSADIGGMKAVMAAFIGHMAYGLLLVEFERNGFPARSLRK